jgi:two-component system, cell cycle response regulator
MRMTEQSRKLPVLITLDGRRVSERFVLGKNVNVLGRDLDADLILSDGEVSRHHAIIEWKNFGTPPDFPDCWVRDNRSTNGTYLNGDIVEGEARLADGDMIRVGRTVLGFFLKDERVLELDQLLLDMALHDSLTQLYKREYFFSELHREFDRSKRHDRPLSVSLIDIDFFKRVNDEHGHLSGDEVLKQFSDLIRLSLREGDICGRYGGEEFAIVFPETDAHGAWMAAERIRAAVDAHEFTITGGRKKRVTCSVGVASMLDRYSDKMQLLDAADHALYEAKQQGRNRTVCHRPERVEHPSGTQHLREKKPEQ